MPVTVRNKQFYTKAEVLSLAPAATIDSQWETYKLTLVNGFKLGWNQNAFHVNKRTGLVTGTIGMDWSNYTGTNLNYATDANLGTHSGLMIKYPGQFEYGTTTTAATPVVRANYRNVNTNISTAGVFSLQGNITTPSAYKGMQANFIENFAYIGSKYGEITDTDVKVEYMQEGEFYDLNSVKLILGKAWLRTNLPLPAGYSSNSYVYVYKNLWSGECILQYSLYPTTAGTTPAIPLPERFRLLKNGTTYPSNYIPIRYAEGWATTATSSAANHNKWMNIGSTISFNAGGLTWLTGSYFYQGNVESRLHQNSTESVIGLWMPDCPAQAVPSVNNAVFPSGYAETNYNLDNYWNPTNYKSRTSNPSWVSYNQRTGMVYAYFDMTLVANAMPDPIIRTGNDWSAPYLPSHRYNQIANTSQAIYLGVNAYLSKTQNTTALGTNEYCSNMCIHTNKSLGVPSDVTNGRLWRWGTPLPAAYEAGNLCIYSAYYLGGSAGNIKA